MKKLLSLILAVCTCLSLCAMLAACGEKTPYEAYFKSHGMKHFDINKTTGETKLDEVTDYYRFSGDIDIGSDGRYVIDIEEITRVDFDPETDTGDYEIAMELSLVYDFRDNMLDVYVEEYEYRAKSSINPGDSYYKWLDGFKFESEDVSEDRPLPLTQFEFDMSKYFENGKLTAEDATAALNLNADYIVSDKEYPALKYTERNPGWKQAAIANILKAVNLALAEVDAATAQ